MSLASFVKREKFIFKAPPRVLVSNSLKPPPGTQEFAVQPQDRDHTYWCWAAVMVSVSEHLGLLGGRDQCMLAQAFIDKCTDCKSTDCDKTKFMEEILSGFDATKNSVPTKQSLPDLSSLTKAIDENRPIVCDGNRDGSLHAEIICGYYNLGGEDFVVVADPAGGGVYNKERYKDYKCFASFIV